MHERFAEITFHGRQLQGEKLKPIITISGIFFAVNTSDWRMR